MRLADGTRIDAYKHTTTRRYLHLSADLCAYAYRAEGSYVPVGLDPAIAAAFDGWERVDPPADQRQQLSIILAAARDIAV